MDARARMPLEMRMVAVMTNGEGALIVLTDVEPGEMMTKLFDECNRLNFCVGALTMQDCDAPLHYLGDNVTAMKAKDWLGILVN